MRKVGKKRQETLVPGLQTHARAVHRVEEEEEGTETHPMVGSERKEEVRRRTGGGSKKKTKPRDACYYKIKRLYKVWPSAASRRSSGVEIRKSIDMLCRV